MCRPPHAELLRTVVLCLGRVLLYTCPVPTIYSTQCVHNFAQTYLLYSLTYPILGDGWLALPLGFHACRIFTPNPSDATRMLSGVHRRVFIVDTYIFHVATRKRHVCYMHHRHPLRTFFTSP